MTTTTTTTTTPTLTWTPTVAALRHRQLAASRVLGMLRGAAGPLSADRRGKRRTVAERTGEASGGGELLLLLLRLHTHTHVSLSAWAAVCAARLGGCEEGGGLLDTARAIVAVVVQQQQHRAVQPAVLQCSTHASALYSSEEYTRNAVREGFVV